MLHYKQEMYWKKNFKTLLQLIQSRGNRSNYGRKKWSFSVWVGLGSTPACFKWSVSRRQRIIVYYTGSAHKRYLEYVVQLGGVVEIVRVPGHVVHLELQDQGIGH